MPEHGKLPLPLKLIKQGITDMVQISDARMSGTGFGTVVLHVAPESSTGGPLAAVKTGDLIELDVAGRRLELLVSDDELRARLRAWKAPKPHFTRGYGKLFEEHVLQANEGCDFDFLVDKEKKRMDLFLSSPRSGFQRVFWLREGNAQPEQQLSGLQVCQAKLLRKVPSINYPIGAVNVGS
jgi:Dehydratase family